jgi:hypothetical protein
VAAQPGSDGEGKGTKLTSGARMSAREERDGD